MEEKFAETHDNLQKFEARLDRLVDYMYGMKNNTDKPLDREELFKELESMLENVIDIRMNLTENFCPDPEAKNTLLNQMKNKKDALVSERLKQNKTL